MQPAQVTTLGHYLLASTAILTSTVTRVATDLYICCSYEFGLIELDEAARDITGAAVRLDERSIRKALDPNEFVRSRNGYGGPAPGQAKRMIAKRTGERDSRRLLSEQRSTADGYGDPGPGSWVRLSNLLRKLSHLRFPESLALMH